MDILASNINNMMHQIEVAVSTVYHPFMELSAISSWDAMDAVERMEAEEAISTVYEPVIETHQRRNIRFRVVTHGVL